MSATADNIRSTLRNLGLGPEQQEEGVVFAGQHPEMDVSQVVEQITKKVEERKETRQADTKQPDTKQQSKK